MNRNSVNVHVGNMSIALRETWKNVNLSFKPKKKSGALGVELSEFTP